MDNSDRTSGHLFEEIEQKLEHLRGVIDLKHSRGVILREINTLLSLLFSQDNILYTEAVFTEFFPVYLKLLESFRVSGAPPSYAKSIIHNAGNLYRINSGAFRQPEMALELKRISSEFRSLKRILRGGTAGSGTGRKGPVFPVIESGDSTAGITYLDSLDVKVTPAPGSTRFIIHPTYKEEEPVLLRQVMDSFSVALPMIPAGKKKLPAAFEVQVCFRSRLGIYSGNSFGVLLAQLIKIEINKLIQPNVVYEISPATAFTGAVSPSGEVKPVGKANIVSKVRAVFFSDVTNFIIPKEDEHAARTTLNRLQEKWPQRKLEITAVNNLTDILNRRDIILISKRPLKERIKATAHKHRYTSLILIPVLVLLGFMYAREFDTNPVGYEITDNAIALKNRYGTVLWTLNLDSEISQSTLVSDAKPRLRVLDLNQDGENEVLISGGLLASNDIDKVRYLYCFNGRKEEIWKFAIQDTVYSFKENKIPPTYEIKIFGLVKIGDRKLLLIWANCVPTYPGAILTIDPSTGEKIGNTLWHAGHIISLGLSNTHSDGRPELVVNAIENAYQVSKFYSVPFPFPEAIIDTRRDYILKNKVVLKPLLEITLPITDYVKQFRNDPVEYFVPKCLIPEESGEVTLDVHSSYRAIDIMYKIVFDSRTHDLNYFIDRRFRRIRDSLVNAGILPLPYTDTKEYTDILKNGVRYKLDGKWVTYQEYVKAGKVKALAPKNK